MTKNQLNSGGIDRRNFLRASGVGLGKNACETKRCFRKCWSNDMENSPSAITQTKSWDIPIKRVGFTVGKLRRKVGDF